MALVEDDRLSASPHSSSERLVDTSPTGRLRTNTTRAPLGRVPAGDRVDRRRLELGEVDVAARRRRPGRGPPASAARRARLVDATTRLHALARGRAGGEERHPRAVGQRLGRLGPQRRSGSAPGGRLRALGAPARDRRAAGGTRRTARARPRRARTRCGPPPPAGCRRPSPRTRSRPGRARPPAPPRRARSTRAGSPASPPPTRRQPTVGTPGEHGVLEVVGGRVPAARRRSRAGRRGRCRPAPSAARPARRGPCRRSPGRRRARAAARPSGRPRRSCRCACRCRSRRASGPRMSTGS